MFFNKIKIFLLILTLSLLSIIYWYFVTNQNYMYKNKNRYWSNIVSGPKSIDNAIKIFFDKKEKLHPLEGIWQDGETKFVAITRSLEAHGNPVLFSKYIIIDEKNKNNVGTIEGSFHRTKFKNKYITFEKINVLTKNYERKNSTGTGFLILNNNNAKVTITSSQELKKMDINYNLLKIYPK